MDEYLDTCRYQYYYISALSTGWVNVAAFYSDMLIDCRLIWVCRGEL